MPLGITFIITTVYFKVDVPILQRFRPYSEVGYYTFAYKPFESLLFIPFALRSVVFPVLSVYHRRSPERVLPLAEKFFKALVILGWPITVGVFLLAPQFNSLLHLYAGSEPALQILALAIVFMFADNTFAATLNAIDKQNVFAFVAMVGLVINVGVNLVVIPSYGYLGASWAVVVTEAALVVVGWFVLRAQLGTHPAPAHVMEGGRRRRGDGRLHLRRQPASEPGAALRGRGRLSADLRGGAARAPGRRSRGDEPDPQRAAIAPLAGRG